MDVLIGDRTTLETNIFSVEAASLSNESIGYRNLESSFFEPC